MIGIYFYRGYTITQMFGGWWFENDLRIYKTVRDAKNAIKKHLDGTHDAEPRIIGEAEYENGEWKLKRRLCCGATNRLSEKAALGGIVNEAANY